MNVRKVFLAMAAFGFSASAVVAQDAEDVISDDDLYKYAIMQEVVDLMKRDISLEVNGMIRAQEGMTGRRYKELAGTKGEEAKLAEISAKDWEIKFLTQIEEFKNKRIAAIKTVNSELATKMVGDRGKSYKAIKEQLANNSDLKVRYSTIAASIKENTD